ncbi:DISP3 [Symbiodinium natans]|uniref:DISP3 protein n=1 Tax=Symbiodinium natans TaxID=878477 RepID=A0A812UN97_9DINO|nr:DISP3 [Symbiodinium natans]
MNDDLLPANLGRLWKTWKNCSYGIAAAIGFLVVACIFVIGYVNLDFSDYLRAELEDQYLLDAAGEASSEQVRKTGNRRRRSEEWKAWTVYAYEQGLLRSNASTNEGSDLRRLQQETSATPVQTTLAYQIWELDIFYQAVDPSKGIFTEEALREIKDFEDRLVSFDGFESFCRRWHDRGASCDVPYSVKNLFFSVPDASLHNGSTMSLSYDGSGTLASIESVLQEMLSNDVRWWTDGDFNRNNLKSQYSRATVYGGAPLPGYLSWDDRQGEQEAKINSWLGRLFEDFLRRADLTGERAFPYQHVKITWFEKRINNYEILFYLRFDSLMALGTMATVALLVLARIQNLFITFFGAIGVALAFVGTYYFHFVVAGFKALTILDFVSLFVILGIAADDVLLLFNTYSLATVLLGAEATPKQKMWWAYKEGTAPMLVTTVTTCGSFYANCFSIVTVVRSFGFFMATLVAWNFLNVLIIFPAAILVNDLYIIPALSWFCRCRMCRRAGRRDQVAQEPQGLQPKRRLTAKGLADVDHEDLGLFDRLVARRFSPCLHTLRWALILLSIVAAATFCYLAVVAFHVSEGAIKVFEEDLNLGRLEQLRKEVFPANTNEDFREAIRVTPPDRAFDVRSCPGRVGSGNSSWCSAQGTCDAASSTCTCDEPFVGQACSVAKAAGMLDLVYFSIAEEPGEYLYAHVLSSPELLAAPSSLPPGRGDFFLRNEGDEDVDWQLDSVPSWLSFAPTAGVLTKRSFSRTDEAYAGRTSFQAALDLAGRPAGWSESASLWIQAATPSTSLPPRLLRVTATVVSPPALAALKAFAEGSEVLLQPAFEVARGFGADPSENRVSQNTEIRYQVSSQSDWLRVDLEVWGGEDAVTVDGRPLRGGSLGISAPGSIQIQVVSSFRDYATTYILDAIRSCDGPCPTETSTSVTTTRITSTLAPGATTTTLTRTTSRTQETDHLVGVMSLTALNCPALQTSEGRSSLASGLAEIAEVEEAAVSISVWCNGRRLSSRQLQVSPAELLYSLVVGGAATADVVNRLELESPETMTNKLQASLDQREGLPPIQLEVLSLGEVLINPDPTTTATTSTMTATASSSTATATSITTTSVSETRTTTTSFTATATSITSSTITKTQSTATSLTLTSSSSSSATTTASSVTSVTTTRSTGTTTTGTRTASTTWTATSTLSTAADTTLTATTTTETAKDSATTATVSTVSTMTATQTEVTTTSITTSTSTTTADASTMTSTVSTTASSTSSSSRTYSATSSTTTSTTDSTVSSSSTETVSSTSSAQPTTTSTLSTLTSTSKSTSTTASSTTTSSSTTLSSTTSVTMTTSASYTSSSSRTGTATSATETSSSSLVSTTATSTGTTSTSSSISTSSSTFSDTTSTLTSITSTSITRTHTWTSTTTESATTSTATLTFADGFGYIYGEVRLGACPDLGLEGLEALRSGIGSVAEVEASSVAVRLCPEQEVGRRLQATPPAPSLEYSIHVPDERGPELFPRALGALLETTPASMQGALNDALASRGFAETLLVLDVSVSSGAPPTTRTSSSTSSLTATSSSTTSTILCPGNPVCAGAGSCVQQESGDWSCECLETFAGEDCTVRVCPTCANNASCLESSQDLDAVWGCTCVEPYYGPRCEEIRCPGNCTNAGDCDTATGECSCFAGHLGEDCAVKEVPLTNAIQITIVFGLLGYKEENRSAPAYDDSVDLWAPPAQAHMLRACSDARADAKLLVKSELSCWIESFAEFMPIVGGSFPVNGSMAEEAFQAFMHQNVAVQKSYQNDVRTSGEDFAGRLMFARLRMQVNMAVNAEREQKDVMRRRWQDFVDTLNLNAPPEAGKAMMMSWVWTALSLEESVFSSTILAFSLSLSTSMVAVALFTRDLMLAFYVCLNILLVVCVLSGFLLNVLGYDFGVVEAIGATIFVGLSVDYCLHLAHGYHTANARQAKVRVHNALVMLTPTILGGALTTIAGCAFLLPCRIILFRKLGWTLMLNAIIAITYTFTFLAPLLMLAGPTQQGIKPEAMAGYLDRGSASSGSPTQSFAAVTSRFVQTEVVPDPTCIGKAAHPGCTFEFGCPG